MGESTPLFLVLSLRTQNRDIVLRLYRYVMFTDDLLNATARAKPHQSGDSRLRIIEDGNANHMAVDDHILYTEVLIATTYYRTILFFLSLC